MLFLWAPKPTGNAWVAGGINNAESQNSKGPYAYNFFLWE